MALSPRSSLALGALLAVGGLCAANLAGLGRNNAVAAQDLDQKAGEDIVRNYLLENPEVIFEAVERYTAKQEAKAMVAAEEEVRANLPTLMAGTAGHAEGAAAGEADVLLVEFFDYHCGYCKQATEFVFDLLEEEKGLRVVFQEMPVVHQQSYDVALASLSLAGTENFAPFHQALMNSSGLVETKQMKAIAKDLGIDVSIINDALNANADRGRLEETLSLSMQMAEAIGISGTPGFIIASPDGEIVEVVPGFSPTAVEEAIAAVRAGS